MPSVANWLNTVAYVLTIKPRIKKLKKLFPEAQIFPTGSRYICSPPSMFTDVDFVVYCPRELSNDLIKCGYVKSSVPDYGIAGDFEGSFSSWRRGNVNLIHTTSITFADRHVIASHICKVHNVLSKYQRIVVHDIVRSEKAKTELYQVEDSLIRKLLESFVSPNRSSIEKIYKLQNDVDCVV